MNETYYLAVDLGAESGRVILGTLAGDRLNLEEIHRFPNRVLTIDGHLHWDVAGLEKEIVSGLEKAARRGLPIAGISADSWGVDYVWVDRAGNPTAQPFCYRDQRTAESSVRFLEAMGFPEIYAETGIQFMAINTLYQLKSELLSGERAQVEHFLLMADYINFRLSGVAVAEESLASTTQVFNPRQRAWSDKLIGTLGLSSSLFPQPVPSGTVLGPVVGPLAKLSSLGGAKVIATCSHDTGAAVAAVPAAGEGNWAYLSSGTWSLLGAELTSPLLTEEAREAGFTNEMGLGGITRFLKNIAGLWVLQECRRAWEAAGQVFNYDELTLLGTAAGPAAAHLSLDDPRFVTAGGMPDKIADYCRETRQPVPASAGEFTRIILESLALCYAQTIGDLENLTGKKIQTLHIVGGGSRNELLNQLTADATGLEVVTGPVEATAIGNILIQALSLGHLSPESSLRAVVRDSFSTKIFLPRKAAFDLKKASSTV